MNKNSRYEDLKRKLEERNKNLKEKIILKHSDAFTWAQNNTRQLAAGAMSSLMLLTTPAFGLLPAHGETAKNEQFVDLPENVFMLTDVKQYLPDAVGNLLPQQEEKVAEILGSYYGFTVKPEMNGMRLNATYGYIGQEQHLKRYPGDNMEEHFTSVADSNLFGSTGMAPGIGGFGYFAHSKNELTQKDIDREKYYIAVQTFMAPGFADKKKDYIDFFKFRKMLVVNPNNGHAVVADIGDAGPAVWTGKQLGGSPEVMRHLQRVDGQDRGAVLYFFIDDPEDKIPLGPIEPVKGS